MDTENRSFTGWVKTGSKLGQNLLLTYHQRVGQNPWVKTPPLQRGGGVMTHREGIDHTRSVVLRLLTHLGIGRRCE
jgi:hypothetical protein